jgi:hypothetical protein
LIGLAVVLAVSLTLAPRTAEAQQAGKVYRLGYLAPAAGRNPLDEVFERSLKDVGYVEGHDLVLERRYVSGRVRSIPVKKVSI